MRLVAETIGVEEGFLAKAITGRVPSKTAAQVSFLFLDLYERLKRAFGNAQTGVIPGSWVRAEHPSLFSFPSCLSATVALLLKVL